MPRMRSGNRGGVREGAGRPVGGNSDRTGDRKVEELELLMGYFTYEQVCKAFIKFTEDIGRVHTTALLKACIWRPSSYNQILNEDDECAVLLEKLGLVKPNPIELLEGLTMLLHLRLSKRQYMQVYSVLDTTGEEVGEVGARE